jgi:UDP-3-O-[3-hydroxymyristoyl] glucosamine N-acyltransferase
MEMTLFDLAKALGGSLTGDGAVVVRGLASLETAGPAEVSFLTNQRYEKHMETTAAAAVIVAEDYAGPGKGLIRCKDPYFAYRQAMVEFYGFRQAPFAGIDGRSAIDPSAQLGTGVRVGPFVTVCRDCRIGDGTVLYPGVFVGPGSTLGNGCTLYSNVSIYDGSRIGDRVTIHANTSIGQDGFGYATHQGRHEKIPQAGCVIIEDDCEIGAGCTIDRATMGATIIGAGTKMSNLVAIGHGTQMGKGCLMVAQSGIAGSTMVGNYCVFAGQAGVVGHIRIGDFAKIAAQSGVTNDVPANAEVLGSPAMERSQARKAIISMTRLPRLRAEVQTLIKEVRAMKKAMGLADRAAPGPEEPSA